MAKTRTNLHRQIVFLISVLEDAAQSTENRLEASRQVIVLRGQVRNARGKGTGKKVAGKRQRGLETLIADLPSQSA
jgi:hypothetical protein